jgi:hypothetical protein
MIHSSVMRSSSPKLALAVAALAVSSAGILLACGDAKKGTFADNTDAGENEAGGGGEAGTADAGGQGVDAGSPGICDLTKAYEVGCGRGGSLTCGDAGFDIWCAQNDAVLNSAAFDRGEAMCSTQANCDAAKRHDCDYQSYASATQTVAEGQLVAAYCATCEPQDAAGCATRATTYNQAAGPTSATDIFIAAWELADPVVDEIRVKCTGLALDAGTGADAGAACAQAFSTCSGGIYIDHLPNCPK